MRFFKYLIFLFLSIYSLNVYSAREYYRSGNTVYFSSPQEVCLNYYSASFFYSSESGSRAGECRRKLDNGFLAFVYFKIIPDQCWHPDYKIVSQDVNNSQIKKSICVPNNGVMCKYTGNLTNAPVVNGYITTTFSSVSKTPDPNCKEELVNPPCDPKDPYGGCYTPPNQECTRQFDGSIVCPEDKEPPIEKGCNGADYCERPPQGCGQGYVSGKFNGKLICIKTNPSTDNPQPPNEGDSGNTGDGISTSTSTGTETTTTTTTNADGSTSTSTSTTTTNTTTINNFKIDLSGVIAAVNAVSAQVSILKNELLSSLSHLSSKLDSTNSKIDATNSKLDTSNTHLSNINDSNLRQEQLLKDIRDKTNSDQPPSGSSTDLTETNGLLGEIRDGINDIKNVFSDEGKEELEKIGQPSDDLRYTNAQSNAQTSINALANKLTFGSSACLSDFQIYLPIFGQINIALSQWCGLLALVKILFQLVVLLTCLRMLDATVRTI